MTKEYIELPRFLNKDEIYLSEIKTLEIVLEEAKEAYRENEGKNLFNEIMENKNCPLLLKEFVKKHNIYKVGFEKLTQFEDYMPDYGKYIILESESESFGFMHECTECYAENGSSPFEGIEFNHDSHFVEVLEEHELLVKEEDWSDELASKAMNTWEYILSYSDIGRERKLYT